MRRSIIVALIVGLVAGSVALPAEAKKKKKKVVLTASETKYFLHWDPDGATPEGCTGAVYMDTEEKVGTTCSTSTQAAQEVLIAAGEEPISYLYPATDGLPLILDSSRKLTGEIVIRGTFTVEGYVELVLTGTVNGAEVEIATGETAAANGLASNSAQGTDLPGPAAVLPVELDINPAVDKLEATSLNLKLTIRGFHRGGVDYHRTPSHIIIPSFTQG